MLSTRDHVHILGLRTSELDTACSAACTPAYHPISLWLAQTSWESANTRVPCTSTSHALDHDVNLNRLIASCLSGAAHHVAGQLGVKLEGERQVCQRRKGKHMNLARHLPALVCDELGRIELALQALPSHPADSGCANPAVLGCRLACLKHDASGKQGGEIEYGTALVLVAGRLFSSAMMCSQDHARPLEDMHAAVGPQMLETKRPTEAWQSSHLHSCLIGISKSVRAVHKVGDAGLGQPRQGGCRALCNRHLSGAAYASAACYRGLLNRVPAAAVCMSVWTMLPQAAPQQPLNDSTALRRW